MYFIFIFIFYVMIYLYNYIYIKQCIKKCVIIILKLYNPKGHTRHRYISNLG